MAGVGVLAKGILGKIPTCRAKRPVHVALVLGSRCYQPKLLSVRLLTVALSLAGYNSAGTCRCRILLHAWLAFQRGCFVPRRAMMFLDLLFVLA